MKRTSRWLLGVCVAAVAVGVLVRLYGRPEAESLPAKPAPVPSARAGANAAPSPSLEQLQARLLKDDRLTPPPPGASAEENALYQSTLEAIRRGQDPLQSAAPKPPVSSQQIQARLDERRKAAEERRKLGELERLKRDEERKKKLGAHPRTVDPSRPPPPPLFPPPDLGPPVVETPPK